MTQCQEVFPNIVSPERYGYGHTNLLKSSSRWDSLI
jgi:hypothetical protein